MKFSVAAVATTLALTVSASAVPASANVEAGKFLPPSTDLTLAFSGKRKKTHLTVNAHAC